MDSLTDTNFLCHKLPAPKSLSYLQIEFLIINVLPERDCNHVVSIDAFEFLCDVNSVRLVGFDLFIPYVKKVFNFAL